MLKLRKRELRLPRPRRTNHAHRSIPLLKQRNLGHIFPRGKLHNPPRDAVPLPPRHVTLSAPGTCPPAPPARSSDPGPTLVRPVPLLVPRAPHVARPHQGPIVRRNLKQQGRPALRADPRSRAVPPAIALARTARRPLKTKRTTPPRSPFLEVPALLHLPHRPDPRRRLPRRIARSGAAALMGQPTTLLHNRRFHLQSAK